MPANVEGYNFADTSDVVFTLTPDDPVTGIMKIQAALAGTAGTVWHVGSAAPTTLFRDGDFYLRTTNGEVYKQIASAWVDQGFSLQGAAGTNGTNGTNGADGSQIYGGSAAPAGGLGAVGDWYFRFDGQVYKKTGSSTWTDQGFPGHTSLPTWAGTMPSVLGAGLEIIVPAVPVGATSSFDITYAKARVAITPIGSSAQFVLEKSAGGGAFSGSPTTIATLTIAPGAYEATSTFGAVTVSTGDLLRLSFAALGGLAAACGYSISLEGSQSA